jgi:hypothetical protein
MFHSCQEFLEHKVKPRTFVHFPLVFRVCYSFRDEVAPGSIRQPWQRDLLHSRSPVPQTQSAHLRAPSVPQTSGSGW